MGFTLSIGRIKDTLEHSEIDRFQKWLDSTWSLVNEAIETLNVPQSFPFVIDEYGDEDSPIPVVLHEEVGGKWWDIVSAQMALTLGPKKVRISTFLRPIHGVAVPFPVENRHLRNADFSGGNFAQRLLMKAIMLSAKKDPSGRDVLITRDGKTIRNLRIASAPGLLAELDAACKAWALPDDERSARKLAKEMYEAEPEDDVAISRCYALMVRSFLRFAIENQCLVWFIK